MKGERGENYSFMVIDRKLTQAHPSVLLFPLFTYEDRMSPSACFWKIDGILFAELNSSTMYQVALSKTTFFCALFLATNLMCLIYFLYYKNH